MRYDPDPSQESPEPLTVREEEILALVAEDMSNPDISKKTGIAISTVQKHIENIYKKIKARSRSSAAIWLLRRQLEARDKEITILKQILAEQSGSSAASSR